MRLVPLDEPSRECGYLPDRDSSYESYLVLEATETEREQLLAAGYRAFGKYVFRPRCGLCAECVPLRVPATKFQLSKSQRRVLKKCKEVQVEIGSPRFTQEKLEIYHDHLQRFQRSDSVSTEEDFRFSFYDPDIPAFEFTYYLDGNLIAFGIVQKTPRAFSSVYFTYRLAFSKLSLGVFSVLQEIEFARQTHRPYVYLGYYVHQNHFMNYKAQYCPNEVLTHSGRWVPYFDSARTCQWARRPEFVPYPCLTDSN